MQRTPDGRQCPHDVPGHNRAGGIDDSVPRREYGDQSADHPVPPSVSPENDSASDSDSGGDRNGDGNSVEEEAER